MPVNDKPNRLKRLTVSLHEDIVREVQVELAKRGGTSAGWTLQRVFTELLRKWLDEKPKTVR